ncbi:MAG: hypothetical protein AAGH15_27180 [Myxococcota bacterium]
MSFWTFWNFVEANLAWLMLLTVVIPVPAEAWRRYRKKLRRDAPLIDRPGAPPD